MRRVAFLLLVTFAIVAAWFAGRSAGPTPVTDDGVFIINDELPDYPPRKPAVEGATKRDVARTPPLAAQSPPTGAPPETASRVPLPTLDEPFAQHLDELRRRAREGDAPAACRLGMQLAYCSHVPTMRRIAAEALAEERRDEKANWARASMTSGLALMESQCRDVVPIDPLEAFRAQLAAARAGIVQAQLQLAGFPPLDAVDVIDQVEVWREWRAAALPGLESALATGDPRAAFELARAYEDSGAPSLTPRLAQPDAQRAYTYRRLVTLLAQRSGTGDPSYFATEEEKSGSLLDDRQREAAAVEAERLLAEHFRGFAPGTPIGGTDGDDFARCED